MKIKIDNLYSKVNFYCENSQYYQGFCNAGISRLIDNKHGTYRLRYNALNYSFDNCLDGIVNNIIDDIYYHDKTFFELEFKDSLNLFKDKLIDKLEKFTIKTLTKRYINKVEKEYNKYNEGDIEHDMILVLEIKLYFDVKGI